MDRQTIRARLQQVFHEVFDDGTIEIKDETTAKDVEGWDSLAHINLIVAVEQRFNLKLATKEVIGLKNVGDFLDLLQKKLVAA